MAAAFPSTKNQVPMCPVPMHFSEQNASIPTTDVDVSQYCRSLGVIIQGQHGFGCDKRGIHSKLDYQLAQKRTADFPQALGLKQPSIVPGQGNHGRSTRFTAGALRR
jgi:hypothetical protein